MLLHEDSHFQRVFALFCSFVQVFRFHFHFHSSLLWIQFYNCNLLIIVGLTYFFLLKSAEEETVKLPADGQFEAFGKVTIMQTTII